MSLLWDDIRTIVFPGFRRLAWDRCVSDVLSVGLVSHGRSYVREEQSDDGWPDEWVKRDQLHKLHLPVFQDKQQPVNGDSSSTNRNSSELGRLSRAHRILRQKQYRVDTRSGA